MAIYINIRKEEVKKNEVIYTYTVNALPPGLLSLNLENGEISQVKKIESDNDKILFARAAHKVKKAFEKGEIPDVLVWAS